MLDGAGDGRSLKSYIPPGIYVGPLEPMLSGYCRGLPEPALRHPAYNKGSSSIFRLDEHDDGSTLHSARFQKRRTIPNQHEAVDTPEPSNAGVNWVLPPGSGWGPLRPRSR